MAQELRAFVPATDLLTATWPEHLLGPLPELGPGPVFVGEVEYPESDHPHLRVEALLRHALPIPLPGIEGTALILGTDASSTRFVLEIEASEPAELRVGEVPLTLRVGRALLRPARRDVDEQGTPTVVEEPGEEPLLVQIGEVAAGIDFDGNLALDLDAGFDLPLCLVGDTGVALEAQGVELHGGGGTPPPGKPAGWRGLTIDRASATLPGDLGALAGALEVADASIGAGGFSGEIAASWTDRPEDQRPGGELFGIGFRLDEVEVGFVQNAFRESSVRGVLTLPFFDRRLAVELGIGLDGELDLEVTGAAEPGDTMHDGLLVLRKPGVCSIEVESLGVEVREGRAAVLLSGVVTPEIAGVELPGFRVDELEIDGEGNVHLEGGWFDLPDQYSVDLFGFQFEITRLGMGKTDEGERWIGLNGGLQLVESIPAGASVEGLRIAWDPAGGSPSVSLEGVGIDFEVPGAFRFEGAVAYEEAAPGRHRFAGAVTLEILPLEITLDAQLVFGTAPGYSYFAIHLGTELPAGIPLFTTGLSLYGVAGLLAHNMEPDRKPDEPWYGAGPEEGWYRRPEPGVTDLAGKWVDREGSFAFGAGVTIGTASDNGYAFSGRFLLAMVLPGPVVMLEGKANLQKKRQSLDEGEPNFRALVVLDGRAGTLEAGLDARYRFDEESGSLVDIRGSVEAFFSYSDPTAWHLYLGRKEPREKRIAAEIFGLWEATSYYMLDARSLAYGAGIGLDEHYRLGPLSVDLVAQMEGGHGSAGCPRTSTARCR